MQSRERILKTAHDLFNRFGIRSVSMDDIASQLGMSKKTVYQVFKDKNEIVDAVFTAMMDENKEQCICCKSEGLNAIDEVFKSFEMVSDMLAHIHPSVLFDLRKFHPGTFKKFDDYRNEFLLQHIQHNMREGITQGLYRDDIDIEILSRYRLHSILLSFDSIVFPSNKTDLLYIEKLLLENFLLGIATSKGQRLIQKYKNRSKSNEEA